MFPTFEEFHETSGLQGLKPAKPVLDTEVQVITPEEFNKTIDAAKQAAQGLPRLKLRRSVLEKVDTLSDIIMKTKRSESL
jgi:hypothetical protein